MNPILKNILVSLGGFILGNLVNISIVMLSFSIITYPAGINSKNMHTIAQHIDKFEFHHFIFPFLAHAIGTLVAAFIAAKWVTTKPMIFALSIGGVFTILGIINSISINSPLNAAIVDMFAYVPMAWLGYKLSGRD